MQIKKEIFRAYDIRGIYPSEINEGTFRRIACALAIKLKEKSYKNVVVGYDDRKSSLSLVNNLVDGLISSGINVINTGITVQPAIHFFTFLDGVDAAVNVTASHNPGMFNGMKIDLKNAIPYFGPMLEELYKLADRNVFENGNGTYREEDLNTKYIEYVSSKFKLKNKLKVVVYCGNGATSDIYPKVLENIGAEVVPLRCYLDSEFPAGLPNPESGNFYTELRDQVHESKADIGVGFDGDGDRVGEVDEKGNFYRADEIFLLYVKEVLAKNPGATIAFDVKCSQLVEKYIKLHGGVPKMMRTGRSYMLDELYSDRVKLAAELSGHTYFKDEYYGFDDGIYAACRLLRILDGTKSKLSSLMSQFPKMVSTSEIKVNCPDEKKFEVIENILRDINDEQLKNKAYIEVITIDGVRAKTSETGWFLIRASNTSPYLSIRIEGKDIAEVDNIMKILTALLKKYLNIEASDFQF